MAVTTLLQGIKNKTVYWCNKSNQTCDWL